MRFVLAALLLGSLLMPAHSQEYYITERADDGTKLYLHLVPPSGNWEWKPTSKGAERFNPQWSKHTVCELRAGSLGRDPRREMAPPTNRKDQALR